MGHSLYKGLTDMNGWGNGQGLIHDIYSVWRGGGGGGA